MVNNQRTLNALIAEVNQALKVNPKYILYGDNKEWYVNAPKKSGTYFIWEGDDIVYVGETGNIRERMGDLKNTRQHTLRRKIGNAIFQSDPDYKPASSKVKFPSTIEQKITNYCKINLKISYVPLAIGRKEIEANYLFQKPQPKYNSPSTR